MAPEPPRLACLIPLGDGMMQLLILPEDIGHQAGTFIPVDECDEGLYDRDGKLIASREVDRP